MSYMKFTVLIAQTNTKQMVISTIKIMKGETLKAMILHEKRPKPSEVVGG